MKRTEPINVLITDRTTLLKALGSQIEMLREKKKMSRADMAKACGFTISKTSKICTGRCDIPLTSLITIKRVLDVHYTDIFGFDYDRYFTRLINNPTQ